MQGSVLTVVRNSKNDISLNRVNALPLRLYKGSYFRSFRWVSSSGNKGVPNVVGRDIDTNAMMDRAKNRVNAFPINTINRLMFIKLLVRE